MWHREQVCASRANISSRGVFAYDCWHSLHGSKWEATRITWGVTFGMRTQPSLPAAVLQLLMCLFGQQGHPLLSHVALQLALV